MPRHFWPVQRALVVGFAMGHLPFLIKEHSAPRLLKHNLNKKWGHGMSWLKKLSVFFVSSAMASVPIAAGFAQGAPAGYGHMINYVQAHEQCAALTWHFTRVANADKTVSISGPIWYENGSGMSLAQGTETNGHFTLNVKMVTGNGPAGT